MSALKEYIQQLLDSDIDEMKRLGATLLQSENLSNEDRKVFMDNFLEEYYNTEPDTIDKALLEAYTKINILLEKECGLKNRIKRI